MDFSNVRDLVNSKREKWKKEWGGNGSKGKVIKYRYIRCTGLAGKLDLGFFSKRKKLRGKEGYVMFVMFMGR